MRADVDHWGPSHADVVVADPPRTGLGKRAVAKVAATHAGRVVLVSCDPAALGRDARLLGEAGYDLISCQLVDLFPHTSHVEVGLPVRPALMVAVGPCRVTWLPYPPWDSNPEPAD